MKPLPVIVLSGFLGAGKTTLLNHLLRTGAPGRRLGVVVNDFGKLNIDRRLLPDEPGRIVELSQGCLCCSLQQDLAATVRLLAERGDLDLLVIEASGVGILSALLRALDAAGLREPIHVVAAVAVIDARRYVRGFHAVPAIQDQVKHASVIVLNHCDEAVATDIEASLARLRTENPAACVLTATRGEVDIGLLLAPAIPPRATAAHVTSGHWLAYEVRWRGPVGTAALLRALDQLPAVVARVKGFVTSGGKVVIVQKAGEFPATIEPIVRPVDEVACDVLVILSRAPVEGALRALGEALPQIRVSVASRMD